VQIFGEDTTEGEEERREEERREEERREEERRGHGII